MTPLKFLWILIAGFIAILLIAIIYVNIVISEGMPSLAELENPKLNLATQIYSADGVLLDHFFVERRVDLPFDSIPKNFINALIATEDRKFYEHWGVHVARIFGAAIKNTLAGYTKEGASTITMQLARNLYLTKEVNINRKIREAFTAIMIEQSYTKEQILQLYSNTVYFGRGAYGIGVAAQVFFGKSPSELTLAECATLVALLKSPVGYDPYLYPEKSLQRRDLILSLMLEQNMITSSQYLEALEQPLINKAQAEVQFDAKKQLSIAPHFVEMIRQSLNDDPRLINYDLYRDGLVINSTLNSRIQKYANEAVKEHLDELQKNFNKNWSWNKNKKILASLIDKAIKSNSLYRAAKSDEKEKIYNKLAANRKFVDSVKNAATTIQVGLVVLDNETGDILAMVGASPKFLRENPNAKYSLNHSTQIRRQPGSAFKPFVYAASLMHGLTPYSQIECGPYSYTLSTGEVWSPSGSGSCGPGETRSLYSALSYSINTVAARLVTQVTTPEEVVKLAKKMGIQSPLGAYPAIALGAAGEVSPLEMAVAFTGFANHGNLVKERFLKNVLDHYGNEVIKNDRKANITYGVLPDSIVEQMVFMMKGTIENGTASVIKQFFNGIECGGKTGTTNEAADAWFIGFTPELTCAIWVGFDDKRINFDYMGSYGYGGRAAAPIWGRLMAKIYNDLLIKYKKKNFGYDYLFRIAPMNYDTPYPQPIIETNPMIQDQQNLETTLPPLPKKPQ